MRACVRACVCVCVCARARLLTVRRTQVVGAGPSSVRDPHYDCQLRQIARDYTKEVVLGGWAAGRAAVRTSLALEKAPGLSGA